MSIFHEHKWVQVAGATWNYDEDKQKTGIFLFCEKCHAACKLALYGDVPQFVYVAKEKK